jgi:hypothetical protein
MEDVTDHLERSEKAVEAIMPSTGARQLKMMLLYEDGTMRETIFIQDTLGFVPIQNFFNKLTREIKNFVDGEYGIKLGELFRGDIEMPSDLSAEKVDEVVEENESIIRAFLKIVEVVPELELDIFALSLGVQRKRVEWFKEAIAEPPHRGGLTIEEGFDILKVFIRQNSAAVKRFFDQEAKALIKEFRLHALDQTEEEMDQNNNSKENSSGGMLSNTSSQDIPESG